MLTTIIHTMRHRTKYIRSGKKRAASSKCRSYYFIKDYYTSTGSNLFFSTFLFLPDILSFSRTRMMYIHGTRISVMMVAKPKPNIMVQDSGPQNALLSPPK